MSEMQHDPMPRLIEMARRKARLRPSAGSCYASSDGKFGYTEWDDGMRHVNPDGPELAAAIEWLTADLAASRAREAKLREALREIELHTWGYPDRLEPMRVEMRHIARAALSASEDAT